MKFEIKKTKDPIYREKKEQNNETPNFLFSEEEDNNNGFGQKIIKLFDENKNLVGNISFDYPDNNPSKMLQIKFVGVAPAFQRQDISLNLYKHLIELAKNKDLNGIKSDNVVQGGALASWKKLEDEGYDLIINPAVQKKYKEFVNAYDEGKFFKESLSVAKNESVFEFVFKSDNRNISQEVLNEADKFEIKPEDRDAEGNLLVFPGGPKSGLNEKNWKIVRTESFKKWFGDWENAEQEQIKVSKIVDKNGEPLLAYHETNKDFEHFDDTKIGSSNDEGYYGAGHYFNFDTGIPGFYAGQKYTAMRGFLNIKRPYYFNDQHAETSFHKYLLNRKPKKEAIEKATEYINVEADKNKLQELEAGTIKKHKDIPKDVDFDIYWEKKRLDLIKYYKEIIPIHEKIIAELPNIYDELNTKYDGVIVAEEGYVLNKDVYTEVVAFSAIQILITQKKKYI